MERVREFILLAFGLLAPIKYCCSMTCLSCHNQSLDSCIKDNKTISCPHPSNQCYTATFYHSNEIYVTKSCVWVGHCAETYICAELPHQCETLECCNKNMCNNSSRTFRYAEIMIVTLLTMILTLVKS